MLQRPRIILTCTFAIGLCVNSTGCLFLGAYPFVQDVPGPVHSVRVLSSETMQDIPDAQVSFNAEWNGICQFDSSNNGVRGASAVTDDPEKISHSGFLGTIDPMHSGLLSRGESGLYPIGLQRKFLPGVGVAVIGFADGPGYIGPFGVKHGESGYVAVVTAWAPGYKPLQVRYHAPLFASFKCEGGEFDADSGTLSIALSRPPPEEGR
jgi:hypothetical protein